MTDPVIAARSSAAGAPAQGPFTTFLARFSLRRRLRLEVVSQDVLRDLGLIDGRSGGRPEL